MDQQAVAVRVMLGPGHVGTPGEETDGARWIREDINRHEAINVLDMILIGQHLT